MPSGFCPHTADRSTQETSCALEKSGRPSQRRVHLLWVIKSEQAELSIPREVQVLGEYLQCHRAGPRRQGCDRWGWTREFRFMWREVSIPGQGVGGPSSGLVLLNPQKCLGTSRNTGAEGHLVPPRSFSQPQLPPQDVAFSGPEGQPGLNLLLCVADSQLGAE